MRTVPHRARRRRTSSSVLALAVAVALTSCSTGGTATTAESGAGLRLAESTEYASLHPLDHPLGITTKFYDGLVNVGENGALEPGLAAQMPTPDEDLTTWTVQLRQDVTFSDGSNFTADDVLAAYDAVRDPAMGSWMAADYAMVDAVTALGEHTVEFKLSHSYAGLPARLTLGIPASEALGDSVLHSSLAAEPVGTGPYVLEDWRRGESMALSSRDDWWAGDPEVERIDIAFVPDENARAQRLRSGEFDGAQLSPRLAAALDGVNDLELVTNPSGDFRGISLPQSLPFFQDPQVRTAVNLATDRQAMIDGILQGHGRPLATPMTPAQGDSYEPSARFDHDPARAAELLDGAGWTLTVDGVREKDGRQFSFALMYFAEDTLRRDLAQAFASDLSELGIRVELEGVDRSQAAASMEDKAFVLGGGDLPYDADTQVYRQVSSDFADYDPDDPYSNPSGYADEQVDRLLAESREEADPQIRAGLYRELQTRLVQNPPMVSLMALEHTYVAQGLDRWDGLAPVVEPHEHGVAWGPWWNVESWTRP
ncbi:ABC transporter substrate-binding protein [Citricoccus sp. NPDC079358]|uniref:ABC transporter substrate-binding protein n=1 Tax=Citricoccus sp. NPDC079358 TaxID=3154653 RepID=UPI00344D8126